MATIYRKRFTKALPDGTELFTDNGQRFARWKDKKGKTRTARVITGKDGSLRLSVQAGTFTAKYRDGLGILREVTTGCRTEEAAQHVLANFIRRAENVRSGIMTPAQDAMIDHQDTPLGKHFDAYLVHMESKGTTPEHRKTTRAQLDRVAADCSFTRLADIDRTIVERWLTAKTRAGASARTRNSYRASIVAFCNWCILTRRLAANPLMGIPKANVRADPRRQRRALTEAELVKLLDATRRRPLLAAMTVSRGKNKGKLLAKVSPKRRQRLERLGRERALIYKTLVLTGLRRSELASITVAQLELDSSCPHIVLYAADEKNREGSTIPVRADLVEDIRGWLGEQLSEMVRQAVSRGQQPPQAVPSETPLFTVPTALVEILDRDLELAGIPKRDDRGRTVDVHAMRHTFGTYLSKGGVPLRTAQAAMRHSDPSLTANVYTDPRLLDVAGAINVLPNLPLDNEETARQSATGTCDRRRPRSAHRAARQMRRNRSRDWQDRHRDKQRQGRQCRRWLHCPDRHLRRRHDRMPEGD